MKAHQLLADLYSPADGYIINEINVTHIGEDYGKVEVHWKNGEIFEWEAPRILALVLASYGKVNDKVDA